MDNENFANVPVLWKPKEENGKMAKKFRKLIQERYKVKLNDYWDLHKWSIENIPQFWGEMWHFEELIYSKPYEKVIDMKVNMADCPEWFPGARLNYAENLLKFRDDRTALIVTGEDKDTEFVSYAQLYDQACLYGEALRKVGFKKGDVAACYVSHRKEAVFAMLGVTSIGGIWTGALPLLGAKAVSSRFRSVKPKILFTIDRFFHEGKEHQMLSKVVEIVKEIPTLEKVIIFTSKKTLQSKDVSGIKNSCVLEEFLKLGYRNDGSIPPLKFEQLPLNHPLFINYTSGTTGLPKAIIHGPGVILTILRDFWLHSDTSRGDVFLTTRPVGWVSWNITITLLALGVSIIVFEGHPYFLSPTYLWDMVDKFQISKLILFPSVLDELERRNYLPTPKHNLSSLKTIITGSSIIKPKNFDCVYERIKKDVILCCIYASTEMMGMCATIDETLPIYRGELTSLSLGIKMHCLDHKGNELVGEVGELFIGAPFPSMPLGLWGDEDGSRFKATYFAQYPDKFTLGDVGMFNPVTRGLIICGRSDGTLKPKGFIFGSSEIYNIVDTFPEVVDSLCVSQYSKEKKERVVLFLKMKENHHFTQELVQKIRSSIAKELSDYYTPEVLLEVEEIPYNLNGKKMESLVKKIINNMPYSDEMLRNPECLEFYRNLPDLQEY